MQLVFIDFYHGYHLSHSLDFQPPDSGSFYFLLAVIRANKRRTLLNGQSNLRVHLCWSVSSFTGCRCCKPSILHPRCWGLRAQWKWDQWEVRAALSGSAQTPSFPLHRQAVSLEMGHSMYTMSSSSHRWLDYQRRGDLSEQIQELNYLEMKQIFKKKKVEGANS